MRFAAHRVFSCAESLESSLHWTIPQAPLDCVAKPNAVQTFVIDFRASAFHQQISFDCVVDSSPSLLSNFNLPFHH